MDKKATLLKKLKEFKENLNKRIHINKIIFFGSRARGEPHKDSDIDLLIISKDFENKKFRYRAIGFYNDWNLEYAVDFLCYTPEEFNKLKNQVTIVRRAVEEGIEIK